jgi:hypothetical protein
MELKLYQFMKMEMESNIKVLLQLRIILQLIELMRFFTPFGIKQYNHIQFKDKTWEEQVSYRQDISELNQIYQKRTVYVGTFIGNYDKGGHKVSR